MSAGTQEEDVFIVEPREQVSKPHILLADDHPHMLSNLCRLADAVGEVVGAVSDGGVAVKEALRLRPDVVVLDIMMPAVGGLEAARFLRRDLPECKVIICSMYAHSELIAEAMAVGVVGFVRKQSAHSDLAPAIRAALAGETFVSPSLEHNAPPPQTNDSSG